MKEQLFTLSGKVPGPLMDLSSSLPGLLIEGTPMGGFLVVHIHGSREDIEKAQGYGLSSYLRRREDENTIMVVSMAVAEAKVLDAASRDGMMLLPPILWKRGRVFLRFLSLTHRSDDVLATIDDARLESKVKMGPGRLEDEVLSSGLMLPTLTRKQGQVLLAALEAGYYESPRGANAGEIAASLGVARSSFEESLRAAESKIVRAVAPLVRMRALGSQWGGADEGAEALHLFARFSEELGLFVRMALKDGRVASIGMSRQEPLEPHEDDHPYLARIIEHLSTGRDDLRDIPVQLSVTPFEREVLDALREIPPGEVITYGEVAERIGHSRAARAVGSACAHNPVPIIIPCHRVVPSTGGLGNYSGGDGPSTKQAILEREGAIIEGRASRAHKRKKDDEKGKEGV